MIYDVAVIGAGILGCMTARELCRYKLSVLVLEKADDVGEGATKANSGILYPGFHPRAHSLKGISCVQGNRMYGQICKELDVPVKYIGSLFSAFNNEGVDMLHDKEQRGIANGVKNLKIISGDEARQMEPGLSQKVTAALYAPSTGIISPFQLILSVSKSAMNNGAEFRFNTEVLHAESSGNVYRLETSKGEVNAKYVVNTAGDFTAAAEQWVRPQDLIVKPRRGEYYIFDTPTSVKHVLYQAKETDEGGILLSPTIEGNLLAGPTSEDVPDYLHTETSRKGLDRVERVAYKLLPEININKVIGNFAGIRTNIKNIAKEEKDFVIRISSPHFVSALGIKNPGMTAAPYLTHKIIELLILEGLPEEKNPEYNPCLKRKKSFLELTDDEQKELIKQNPLYGVIVCRCENITAGDVMEILGSPGVPPTINALKKRLRVTMGRCQGGFCTPALIELICRCRNLSPEQVLKKLPQSNMVKGRVRT